MFRAVYRNYMTIRRTRTFANHKRPHALTKDYRLKRLLFAVAYLHYRLS